MKWILTTKAQSQEEENLSLSLTLRLGVWFCYRLERLSA
jgi:hypothetical protein